VWLSDHFKRSDNALKNKDKKQMREGQKRFP
jgi:hypothetical protein